MRTPSLSHMLAQPQESASLDEGEEQRSGVRRVAHSDVVAPPPPSFAEVYEECFDFAWRRARMLGAPESAVPDVVQEAFVVVHRRLDDYNASKGSLKAWVHGIVRGVVLNHLRSQRRKPTTQLDDENALRTPSNPPLNFVARKQAAKLLETLLGELDEEKREVLVLSELEQMSPQEIAEVTDTNINTVYARLRVAREQFEKVLARYRAQEMRRSGCLA